MSTAAISSALSQITDLQKNLPRVSETPATTGSAGGPSLSTGAGGVSFADKLKEAVDHTNDLQRTAETMATQYADGTQNDLHGTMIAAAQADISLRLAVNVRNRAIEAYREIMRMGA